VLIEAIKEQNEKIDKLQKIVDNLKWVSVKISFAKISWAEYGSPTDKEYSYSVTLKNFKKVYRLVSR
jgi:hypothetical protein